MMTKPSHASSLLVLLALVCVAAPVRADDYPNRPVRIMVGFIPGSAADLTARVLGNGLGKLLGQQFVVENKAGAGSSLAAEFSARAAKDGHTLFLGSSANITNQVITPNLGFDMGKDFAPIALATQAPVILVVHPSTGVKSLRELIGLAKAKPGEILYASTGVGTAPHLAAELFDTRAGVLLRQHHNVQAILRHIDTAEREHSHLRIPCLLMRARAQATVRVWKKRLELQAHSRSHDRTGCGLPVATGTRS
jgi:tripartite-type tricarboxylate transporter receptor subunit TctC